MTNTITTTGVTNAAPQAVYQTERFGTSTYTFPSLTASAPYTVRLHFAELFQTAAGRRVFNVLINGTTVLSSFDIFATAGAAFKAVVRDFAASASGQIVINFNTVTDNATIEGIEIIPATPNNPPTIATAAAANPNPVTGKTAALSVLGADDGGEGNLAYSWATTGTPPAAVTFGASGTNACGGSAASPFTADQFSSGGTARTVTNTINVSGVTNAAPQGVYRSERYGNVTYTLPSLVAGAGYTVRLHFAELFQTASGKRVFNVAINGTTVLPNFDIFATTGAAFKATVRELTAIVNSSGQIVINLTTITDNATIEGIEIIRQ